MKMDTIKPKFCVAYINNKLISIRACIECGLIKMNPKATPYYLNIDSSFQKIGASILASLKESENLTYEESLVLFPESKKFYDEWVQELAQKCGYKTKRATFQRMANIAIDKEGDTIILHPSHHDKLEGWGATFRGEADHIHIPAASPPEKIGEAFWEALRRCTGPRPDFLNSPLS